MPAPAEPLPPVGPTDIPPAQTPDVAPSPGPETESVVKPEAAATTAAPAGEPEPDLLESDELERPGYVPGYRRHLDLGLSPYAPRVGTPPGGMTSSYGALAPEPDGGWNFTFSGYMTASLQMSLDARPDPDNGQAKTTYHTPPYTVEDYWNFTGTSTIPGNWVHMNFAYGNEHVTATTQINTYNPTRPTTYYAMGSQGFIANAFLTFRAPPIADIRLRWNVGYFANSYGNLNRYGNGLYTNSITGGPRGVGETMTAEYDLGENTTLIFEHGIMMDRNAKVPDDVVPLPVNGYQNPEWPAAFVHHAHLGLNYRTDTDWQFYVHYLDNFAQDDRIERNVDNLGTRSLDETHIKDGYIRVFSADAKAISALWGTAGIAVAMYDAKDSWPLKGLWGYPGDGERLTERYLGIDSRGTGKLYVAGFNHQFSLGTLLSYPVTFSNGPDLQVQYGMHILTVDSPVPEFNGRVRHKYGLDMMYVLSRHFGVGVRGDRVVPNSKDPEETFHVLAPVLQWKSDWNSRDYLTLKYAKWFYGAHTRRDDGRPATQLDDQLIALNFNMWW
jgi:hypothetical protein